MSNGFVLGLGVGVIIASVLLTASAYIGRQQALIPQLTICDGYGI